jgi:hypothetical protein
MRPWAPDVVKAAAFEELAVQHPKRQAQLLFRVTSRGGATAEAADAVCPPTRIAPLARVWMAHRNSRKVHARSRRY